MVLTTDWRRDVCRLIREADLADIKRHDDVASYYAVAQNKIVQAIREYFLHGTPMGRNEVEHIVSMELQDVTKSWDRLQRLVDSICSRLAIEF